MEFLNHDLAEQYELDKYDPETLKKILGNTNIGQVTFEKVGNETYVVHQLHLNSGDPKKKTFTRRTLLTPPSISKKPSL